MIRIAIIEDVSAIRRSLTTFLNTESGCEVVASCESVEEFLALDASAIQVNVILSDIGLPGMNGIEGIKLFKKLYPDAEIIMLTVFQDEAHIFKALCAGATGYLLKITPFPKIILEHFNPKRTYGTKEDVLTAREKQVLQLMVEGLSYKMIGARLDTSLDTVRSQVKSIYRKLHVNSKAEAISIAIHHKLKG